MRTTSRSADHQRDQRRPAAPGPATFTFSSADIGRNIKVFALEGTNAIGQLRQVGPAEVMMVGLRNIPAGRAR